MLAAEKSDTQMMDLALAYAGRDWPVFPCRPGDDYDPDTGEVLPEKAPLISNGFRGATLNERVIRELWKRNPMAVVGVPTGERTNVWVLDLDIKATANGHEWLEDMEATHGPLPYSARVSTANGGTHIFFRYVEGVRNRGKLGAGVDVRGEGGFVIAGNSIMADGRSYKWLDNTSPDDIVDAPQWLLDLVLPPKYEHQPGHWDYSSNSNDRYVSRAVEAELADLASTPAGGRGEAVNRSAYSLGQLVGAGALDRAEAEHGLFAAAVTCGVVQKDGEREIRAKIRRGLDAGEKQPRQIPKPDYDNDNTRLVDIKRMLERGREKAAGKAAQQVSAVPSVAQAEAPPPPQQAEAVPSDGPQGEPVGPSTPQQSTGIFITPYQFKDPKTIQRREFAFGTHYIRKYVSVTVSPGGLGKTSNSIVEALSMASGRPLLGIKPPQRMKVWLFNAEDPRDEMERRIQAACIHYKLGPDDLNGYLFLDTGREQELVVAVEDRKSSVRYQVPIIESVITNLRANEIDVMIVDPFVSTHGVNENDNGAIDKVAKLWAHIADETNTAVDVVHHLRKVADREATVEDARGAVALIGAARSVRVLNRMSEDQATAAAVPKEERFSFFNIHQGKSNLTKMSAAQNWRKLESVPLGNGRGLDKPQDHAGVVTEWAWPGSQEVAEGLTAEQKTNIRSVLAGGAYKKAPQGRPWAGEAVAYALGMDITDKGEKQRAGSILKALIAEGVLVEIDERDPSSRQVARIVRGAE